MPAHFSLSKNPDFGEEIGVKVLIKDENRQKKQHAVYAFCNADVDEHDAQNIFMAYDS